MVYLMLAFGVCISGYGIILLKKETKEKELLLHEKEEVIFNDEDIYEDEHIGIEDTKDKDLEDSIDFNEIIKEKMGSIEVEYNEERNEKINEKLNRIEDMLKPMVDTTDREKKLLLFEKEIIKRERAVKRNETRIDKLVEAKMKIASKTKSTTTRNTNKVSIDNIVVESTKKGITANASMNKTISDKSKMEDENNKNAIIQKINALEEQGKKLEEIASELSLGKGEVLLLRSIQKQL